MANKTEQIGFYLTKETKEDLIKLAKKNDRSMSGEIIALIKQEVKKLEENHGNK